jgi:hypothetical protein
MGLTMKERQKITAILAGRYQKVRKKDKGIVLNEFTALTGYTRSYATYILRAHGRKVRIAEDMIVEGDVRKRAKRKGKKLYDTEVKKALTKIWAIMDCICGKRLAPILKEILHILERHKEIKVDRGTRKKLCQISAATIDRLLAEARKKYTLKGRSHTKPGTLLKSQIPIRTFSEWDDKRAGFVEIDLVAHDGGDAQGDFAQTLDVTDVCTGWTETQAVKNKAQVWVFEALQDIRNRVPFDILGIDSDNGAEFINHQLFRFCTTEQITFTRARSYRKNDNCFVEQKNYSVVRRSVGYGRYDTEAEVTLLNELYGYLRLYTNFFQPVMKLISKTRNGSKVMKKYDTSRTPFQRVLGSPHISEERKARLKKQYTSLNPAALKRAITKLQDKLLKIASSMKQSRIQKNLSAGSDNNTLLGGYSAKGSSEKTDYKVFGEATPSGFSPKILIVLKKDQKRPKRVR